MSSDDINRETLESLSLSELQELATERGLETDCRTHSTEYPEDILISRILYDARMRRKTVINAPQLEGLQNIIAALDTAKSPYFCVGSLPMDASSPVKILIASETSENTPTTYTPIQFPLTHEAAIQPLIDASQQASFGRGGKDVLDPSYRRALVLNPDRITITPAGSLEPHAMGIVEAISQSLVSISDGSVSHRRVVAVFDKLNVYSEGDFFKGHVDTPSSPGMFGTLLINLPVAHEGGQLVVRAPEASRKHRKGVRDGSEGTPKQYMTNWAGSTDINWIAFFSDCEHEVLPVTRGNRVTLSYTLSFAGPIKEAKQNHPVDIETMAGSKDLARQRLIHALKAPGVLTEDRPCLCFYLQHKYPVDWEDPDLWSIKSHLKGRDAVLYHALQAIDAEISLHLVFFTDYEIENDIKDYDAGEGSIAILPAEAEVSDLVRDSHGPAGTLQQMMEKANAQMPEEMGLVEVPGDPELFVRLASLSYDDGPDCTEEVFYGSMCLIATLVPKSASTEHNDSPLSPSERKRKLSESEEDGHQRPPLKM